jgi:nucleoside-diphosphate-sugar epimerase
LSETHLVTGATGFIGSALVLELLRTTDAQVVCLVRPHGDEQAAHARLQQVLTDGANAFGMPEVVDMIRDRCRAVPSDVCMEGCGVASELVGRVNEVWHSAASLRYEDSLEETIFESNVEGTRRVLALSRAAGAEKFNYISTAYVAGSRTGVILEELSRPGTPVNNCYERSKIEAEQLVARSGFHYRIMRPSIVIGHSKTSAVINPTGFYAVARKLAQLRRILERRNLLEMAADLEIEGDPDVPLNLIPVDAVVSCAVRISRSRSLDDVFHLTNAQPPTLGRAMTQGIAELGMTGPRLTKVIRSKSIYTTELNKHLRFFLSYMTSPKEFDQTRTDAIVGPEASRWPIDDEGVRRYVRWYIDHQYSKDRKRH